MGVQDWHFAGWSERANASVPNYLPSASFYLTRNMELYTVFTQPPAVPPSQGESVRFTVQTGAHTKYMSGVNDGPFHPDQPLTRAEVAVVFNRLLGRVPDSSAVYASNLRYFPDVPTNHWTYAQVMEASTTHGHTPVWPTPPARPPMLFLP